MQPPVTTSVHPAMCFKKVLFALQSDASDTTTMMIARTTVNMIEMMMTMMMTKTMTRRDGQMNCFTVKMESFVSPLLQPHY